MQRLQENPTGQNIFSYLCSPQTNKKGRNVVGIEKSVEVVEEGEEEVRIMVEVREEELTRWQ